MAYTYQGDAILGISLTVDTPQPLDTRTVVSTTKDLYGVPKGQAYRGMTVSNLEDGNIYMLIDENKINKSEGWKSSQSALQIISCTQEEYDAWVANTDEKYNPINPSEPYVSQGIYYYIQEEENGIYYLTSTWGKNIEDQLSKKASNDGLTSLLKTVNELSDNLKNNYTTTETLLVTYVTNTALEAQLAAERASLEELIANYYTKEETDNTFVKKSDLGGDLEGLEGENFVFVTSKQYADDQAALRAELDQTLKLDGEGSLESITVGQIKSPIIEGEEQLTVDVTNEGLIINGDRLAGKSEIPVIISISKEEYDKKVEEGSIDEEAYYYVYNTDEDLVYVTNKDLLASYHTTGQYQSWVAGYSYSREDIDKVVATLQDKGDYVLLNQLNDYYTKVESDDLFLTKTDAQATYATGVDLESLAQDVASNYVLKSDLRPDPENPGDDDDFIFVTQKAYSDDKEALAEAMAASFETEDFTTSKITLKDGVELTSEEERLLHNGDRVALLKEVHKVEVMTETEYQELITNKEVKDDTFYYTYEENNKAPTGYVQLEHIETNYYTKRAVDDLLRNYGDDSSISLSEEVDKLNTSIAALDSKVTGQIEQLTTDTTEQVTNIVSVLLVELENRLQAQIDGMQVYSEVSEHKLSIADNDIMMVQGETLHILSPSKVSVNGLQIVVD